MLIGDLPRSSRLFKIWCKLTCFGFRFYGTSNKGLASKASSLCCVTWKQWTASPLRASHRSRGAVRVRCTCVHECSDEPVLSLPLSTPASTPLPLSRLGQGFLCCACSCACCVSLSVRTPVCYKHFFVFAPIPSLPAMF